MRSRHQAVPECDMPEDSPLVGRRFDLDAVVALFDDVVATGQSRLVAVVGPAGIGKSRLVREAMTAVSRSHPSARILVGRCVAAERGMTWWSLAELLHQLCEISLEESAETAGVKLREGLIPILSRAGFADGELDPIVFALAATEVDRLVEEGLAAAGGDEASQARLLVAKGGSARLWRGSEPFGQGTRSDPSPINERIASVHTALEVGERRGLDDLITSANAALGVLYGVAGRYGDALAVAERRLARAETRSRQELVDALRTAAVLTITIKGDFETGLELARRCHALARDAVAHQRMHITWPLAFVEALVALEDWRTLDKILPHARAAARGNALLEPICDRASGLMTAAYGDRRSARMHLVRALSGFEKLKEQYQAARTRQTMAAVTTVRGAAV